MPHLSLFYMFTIYNEKRVFGPHDPTIVLLCMKIPSKPNEFLSTVLINFKRYSSSLTLRYIKVSFYRHFNNNYQLKTIHRHRIYIKKIKCQSSIDKAKA